MNPPSVPGAFLQILEFRTDRPEQFPAVLQRWLDAIGGRTDDPVVPDRRGS